MDCGRAGKQRQVSWAPVRIHGQIADIAGNWVLICHLCGWGQISDHPALEGDVHFRWRKRQGMLYCQVRNRALEIRHGDRA